MLYLFGYGFLLLVLLAILGLTIYLAVRGPQGPAAWSVRDDTTTGTAATSGADQAITDLTLVSESGITYNGTTGEWTIKQAGAYTLSATVYSTADSTPGYVFWKYNAGASTVSAPIVANSGQSRWGATVSATVYLAAADVVTLNVHQSSGNSRTFFTSNASIVL